MIKCLLHERFLKGFDKVYSYFIKRSCLLDKKIAVNYELVKNVPENKLKDCNAKVSHVSTGVTWIVCRKIEYKRFNPLIYSEI